MLIYSTFVSVASKHMVPPFLLYSMGSEVSFLCFTWWKRQTCLYLVDRLWCLQWPAYISFQLVLSNKYVLFCMLSWLPSCLNLNIRVSMARRRKRREKEEKRKVTCNPGNGDGSIWADSARCGFLTFWWPRRSSDYDHPNMHSYISSSESSVCTPDCSFTLNR